MVLREGHLLNRRLAELPIRGIAIMSVNRIVVGAALFLSLLGINTASAATYNYVGDKYTSAFGVYDTTMNITGSFTVDTPLGANLSDYLVIPTFSSFFDGYQFFTNTDLGLMLITTNTQGNIIEWEIFYDKGGPGFITSHSSFGDSTEISGVGSGRVRTIGSWTTVANVPLPAALPLLGASLAGLGVFGWVRRRSKASLPT